METHKCAECGLLGARKHTVPELLEVEENHRAKWEPGAIYETFPICQAKVISFRAEAEKGEGKTNDRTDRELRKDRPCDRFISWNRSFSPKEHAEMQADLELRQYQEEREEKDRRFREEVRQNDLQRENERQEKDRRFQKELKDSTEAWQRREHILNRRWGIAGTLIGVALGAVLGWFLRPSTPEQKLPIINNVIQIPDKR